MASPKPSLELDQRFDAIILGASGFTGKYVVREFLKHIRASNGQSRRLALAGRSISKMADALAWAAKPSVALSLPLLVADAHNSASMRYLCSRTSVLVNCIGPCNLHGELIVAACVEAGVHYVDISGEAEFMEKMEAKYHEKALKTGSLVVSGCGFVSMMSDIGLLHHLRQWQNLEIPNSIDSYLRNRSAKSFSVNAASVETAIIALGNAKELARFRGSGPRRPRLKVPGRKAEKAKALHREGLIGLWATRLPICDQAVVRRTLWTLAQHPDGLQPLDETEEEKEQRRRMWAPIKPVHYGVFLGAKHFLTVLLFTWAARILMFLARHAVGRRLLLHYPEVFTGGVFTNEGPKEEEVESASFEMWFVGRGYSSKEVADRRMERDVEVVTRIEGPESAYLTTAIAVVQSALLCLDGRRSLPRGGVLTTAVAFGASDVQARFQKSGLSFQLISKTYK